MSVAREALEENQLLRLMLWLKHGCPPSSLYGDDGEMQCSSCLLDFKRDDAEKINERFSYFAMLNND